MRFSRVVLLLLVAAFGLQGCILFSKEERKIKSPCVRAGNGQQTCERHPVNQWWLG
ncbi:putative VirB7 [Anaplasma centrale str. Israel]|uniref:Putative VirB7 n=2 Tax=Anaplasma centrale TaxID=769 RepID=D1ASM9_ANACI|nr:putative VirB7 [Anaplasma centrale str. Israel]